MTCSGVREGPCILEVAYKVGRQNFRYTVSCTTHRVRQGVCKYLASDLYPCPFPRLPYTCAAGLTH